MTKKRQVHTSDHVSMGTRIGWGFGGLADNYIMNVLNVIFLVVYVQHFKMPPMLAAAALAIPRFMDAITDPLIGNISDNTRSRWGRRRPYLVWGAVLSAILLPLFWVPPGDATDAIWWQNPAFIYAVVLGSVYAVTYTLFVVPYTALGYELTPDYDEKTRVLAWRMYIGLIGSLTVPWAYKLAQNDRFADEGSGAFWVSIGFGLIIIVAGIIPALVCRERQDVQKQETSPFFRSLGATMTNRPFMILLIAYIIIIVGLFSAGNLGAFLNIYYIGGGNKDLGGLLVAVAGSLGAIVSYLSMFLITAVSTRTGKKTGMFLGLVLALLGVGGAWWAMDPRWPMAQLITTVIACMGLQGCWLMVSSMVADVCDEDELKTGLRREGMFGAVNGFALKAALSITAMIGGILLTVTGFNVEEIDQFETRTISGVIEPAHELQIATPAFARAGERFIEIADDKSSMDGSKWTVLWRLMKGENAFFRWYDFEDALIELVRDLPVQRPEVADYIASVETGFMVEFAEQKRIALLMKKLIIGSQVVGLIAAMAVFAFYPITRQRAEETRRLLDERKESKLPAGVR